MSDSLNWDELYRIVEEARGLAEADREAFVLRECGEDRALLEAVQQVLGTEVEGNFMEPPNYDATSAFG
ncbi:MAG TPA: hypothetical protein P5218_13220, partial [Planctomycetota bacterium]|nr:hypothetical protein [Planctomycetota bacterium]